MSKKSSVYFGPRLVDHTTILRMGDSISGRVNRTAERYMEIVNQHGVYLTDAEMDHIAGLIGKGFATIEQIKKLSTLVARSKSDMLDTEKLAQKLNLTFADLVAVVESVEKRGSR